MMPRVLRQGCLLAIASLIAAASASPQASSPAAQAGAPGRLMRPEDLFRVEQVSALAYSPDGRMASVELRRPGRWLDRGIPTARLAVIDVAAGRLRVISTSSSAYVGFFGAAWSPDGRRLLFLSVDTSAVVRPWLWTVGSGPPRLLPDLELADGAADPPVVLWSDAEHAVLTLREPGAANEGPLYASIVRNRNVADEWSRARSGRTAVAVMDARRPDTVAAMRRLASMNVRTLETTTLARGPVHRPRLSADRRTLTYRSESPPFAATPMATFFGPDARGEAAYDLVNWGGRVHHIDSRTGAAVPPPDTARPRAGEPAARPLRVVSDPDSGTALILTRTGKPDTALWKGNRWVRELRLGRAEAVTYAAVGGRELTGWVLYPPGYAPGRPIPIVTVVYAGAIFGPRAPPSFDVLRENFEHPQMLAALGHGVVLPSMPEPEPPMQRHAMDSLPNGVLPLLDTLIRRGIADSQRIAVLGQSAGGHAVLGLIAQTGRFRAAIASASYANLESLYGTFYGQYRYGDAGRPERAQVLRMLQFERGYYGAAAPPWEEPARYRENSPITRVASIRTPLLLIHGDADFIPVQQAEEMFSALYRQDRRVRLVRYAGEGHTISARANVLDMWRRIAAWLEETMPGRADR
ncbi:MAG: prolyl oligopeptidase family serine peptidase [Gemmatimonadales bacterium]